MHYSVEQGNLVISGVPVGPLQNFAHDCGLQGVERRAFVSLRCKYVEGENRPVRDGDSGLGRSPTGWRQCGWSICVHPAFGPGVPLATDGQVVLFFHFGNTVLVRKENLIGPVGLWDTAIEEWDYTRNTRKVSVFKRKDGNVVIVPHTHGITRLTKAELESDAHFADAAREHRGSLEEFVEVCRKLEEFQNESSEAGKHKPASRKSTISSEVLAILAEL